MFEGALKDFARSSRDLFIFEPDHEFIINVEAALVEVRRADINDVIDDDQLRVQDLRLILINVETTSEQTPIKTLAGKL